MKNILGLDLGTNSIGWSMVQQNDDNKPTTILGLGSRIIPITNLKANNNKPLSN